MFHPGQFSSRLISLNEAGHDRADIRGGLKEIMVNRFIHGLLLTMSLLLVTACDSGASPDQDSAGSTPVSPTSVSTEVSSVYVPPHKQPGPAMDTVHFKAFHVDRAPLHVQAGDMDLYMSSLKSAAAKTLQTDPNIHLYKAPATTLSIILNPAPAPEGQINPFAIKRIRQAIQLLVNREFIVNDIYQGLGIKVKKESMIKIERYIEDQKKYQKNTHQLSDNIKKRLMKQWRFAFDHWNYTYPDN